MILLEDGQVPRETVLPFGIQALVEEIPISCRGLYPVIDNIWA